MTPRAGNQSSTQSTSGRPMSKTTSLDSQVPFEESRSWSTPAVFDVTGGPYRTEMRNGAFRSKHDNKADSPWYGAKLRDAVESTGERKDRK